MKSLLLTFALLLGQTAFARPEGVSEVKAMNAAYDGQQSHYPSWFRVSFLAGPGMRDFNLNSGSDRFESGSEKAYRGSSGSLLLGLGRGMLTLETGVMALGTAADVHTRTELRPHLVDALYVGVPVFLKLNYIERPLASFSLKLGAMPGARMQNHSSKGVSVTAADGTESRVFLPSTDTLLIGGFSGTAPMTRNSAFLVDMSYYRGTIDLDEQGARNQGMLLSLGVVYSL